MSNKFTGITSAGSAIPVYDKDAHEALSSKLDTSAFSSVSGEFATVDDVVAAVSGKADTSAIPSLDGYATQEWVGEQGYLTEVPAGYATTEDVISATSGLQPSGDYASATDLANYQTIEGMSAYQPSGDYQPAGSYLSANALDSVSGGWNEVSAKLDTTAFSDVSGSFLTTIPDTYLQNTDLTIVDNKITEISGVPLSAGDELPSGVMNTSALGYNAVNEISGYNGSAIAQYGAEKQWLVHDDTLVHAANSAQYALGVNLSAVAQLLGIDETVLWSGRLAWGQTAALSDSVKNYDRIRFYVEESNRHRKATNELVLTDLSNANLREFALNMQDATTSYFGNYFTVYNVNEAGDSLTSVSGRQWWYSPWTTTAINGSTDRGLFLTKVIGIGRKA